MSNTFPVGTLLTLIFGVALIVLDSTIVGVSLPTIIADLGLTLTQAAWVTSLYSVVFAALLLTMGMLGDKFGTRRMFMIGLAFFAVGSLVVAMASSFTPLLIARGIQGIGGAIVLPATLSAINSSFRGPQRAAAFGAWGATMASAAAIGPLVGGALTEFLSWPWIFLVNPPICALLIYFAWKKLDHGHTVDKGIDLPGTLLSVVAFGSLVFGLIEGSNYGWWNAKQDFSIAGISPTPIAIIVGIIALVAFVLVESARVRAGKDGLLDPRLFKLPSFAAGNATAMTVAIGEFAALFVLPLYLINVADLTTIKAGLVLAALALGAILSGGAARHLATKLGPALTVVIGLVLEIVGIVFAAIVIGPGANMWCLSAILAIYGAGVGLASAQLASVTLSDVPVEISGMGSASQSTFRQLGSAIGAALAGTTLASYVSHNLSRDLESMGMPGAQNIADATANSAGSAMRGIAQGNTQLLDVLHHGFSEGTAFSLYTAAACLGLGLIASLVLLRTSRVKG